MTDLAGICNDVRNWMNRDWDDSTITQFVRLAEDRMSLDLRVADMIKTVTLTVTSGQITLPADWREVDLVRIVDVGTFTYISREDMYNKETTETKRKYTITGNTIVFGGGSLYEGKSAVVSYYADVPALNEANWLSTRYYQMFLTATLLFASGYAVEDERAMQWEAYVSAQIDKLNAEHTVSKVSGSQLFDRKRRGFG